MIPKGLILPAATISALLASAPVQATGIIKSSGIGFKLGGFGFANSGAKQQHGGKDIFHLLSGSKSPSFSGSHFGISFGKNPGKGTIFDPKGHDYGKDKGKDGKGHGGKGHGGKGFGGKDKDPFKGGIHFGKDWFKWIKKHGQHGHHHGPDCGHGGGDNGNPSTPPVPEPATWAFMILGFGLMGAALRRGTPTARTTIQYS